MKGRGRWGREGEERKSVEKNAEANTKNKNKKKKKKEKRRRKKVKREGKQEWLPPNYGVHDIDISLVLILHDVIEGL